MTRPTAWSASSRRSPTACLYMIDLVCDDELRSFYEKLGMQAITAMARRDMAGEPA